MLTRITSLCFALTLAAMAQNAPAPAPAARTMARIDALSAHWGDISRQLWENPEVGFNEVKSSALVREELRAAGFRITENAGGMPTAFIAEWGQGKPVIAILGEYDALPGLSQDAEPARSPRVTGAPGHGCGHNLFAAATAMAAIVAKEHLAASGKSGTIRFYGSPAEEGGGGKIYLLRAGAFGDVDAALTMHPWDANQADDNSWLANISVRARFRGKAAHAAAAPEQGRSALDGLELATHAINLLREHVPQETRMHYIITNGGAAANIVPDFAELALIVRHPDLPILESISARVENCLKAGALGTGTEVEIEVVASYANMLPNATLVNLLDGDVRLAVATAQPYSDEERAFAEKLRKTFDKPSLPPLEQAWSVKPPKRDLLSASSDVGDVSWNVPTGEVLAATFPAGTSLHSWQSTACAGTSLGRKGMTIAAKSMALAAIDLFDDPSKVAAARSDFEKALAGRTYRSLLPPGAQPKAH